MIRSRIWLILLLPLAWGRCGPATPPVEYPAFSVREEATSVLVLDPAGRPIFGYRTAAFRPGEEAPTVESVGFIHPLYTPAGVLVSDLAPDDHPHHRGAFVGWVEMVGKTRADYWGWGAKAPKEDRRIVNQALDVRTADSAGVSLEVRNSWKAEGEEFVQESTSLQARQTGNSNIVDLEFRFVTPGPPVRIKPSPFGGFCYRAAPRGEAMVTGPAGPVDLPDPIYDQFDTNWPDAGWYDLAYRSPAGKVSGVAVMSHPQNPPTTWFVHRELHMVNPCIVANQKVTVSLDSPLTLRYRLVAHDGEADQVGLRQLYEEFSSP